MMGLQGLVKVTQKLLGNTCPALLKGPQARNATQASVISWVLAKIHCCSLESSAVVSGHRDAVMPSVNKLGAGGVVIGDHGQAAGHGFRHHIAPGFGQGGKNK
jgi:hypothetical protein